MKVKAFRDYLASVQTVESFLKHDEFKTYLAKYTEGLKKDFETLEMYKEKK